MKNCYDLGARSRYSINFNRTNIIAVNNFLNFIVIKMIKTIIYVYMYIFTIYKWRYSYFVRISCLYMTYTLA